MRVCLRQLRLVSIACPSQLLNGGAGLVTQLSFVKAGGQLMLYVVYEFGIAVCAVHRFTTGHVKSADVAHNGQFVAG